MADKVLDFVGKREEQIERKRRSFERLLFQNFLGAYSVIDEEGSIYPITLVDISHSGCLFRVPWDPKSDQKFKKDTEITLKMYFTKKSYIPIIVNVRHNKEVYGNDGTPYMQYGCEFDQSMASFEALQSFIDFMYKFAEHSAIDKGETRVFFL